MGILSIFKRLHTLSHEDFGYHKKRVFPWGQRDIDAVREDYQYLLGELVDPEIAERVGVDIVVHARRLEDPPNWWIRMFLSGHGLKRVDPERIKAIADYLRFLKEAAYAGKTPSEIRLEGNQWVIPKHSYMFVPRKRETQIHRQPS